MGSLLGEFSGVMVSEVNADQLLLPLRHSMSDGTIICGLAQFRSIVAQIHAFCGCRMTMCVRMLRKFILRRYKPKPIVFNQI